jgi:hypothetical protein
MRFKKSCQPNEIKNEYQPDTTFSITLPRGIIDLHTFTLYYKANPANYKHIETVDTTTNMTFLSDAVDPTAGIENITKPFHGYDDDTEVIYIRGASASIGLTNNTTYYIVNTTRDEFQLADGLGNLMNLTAGTAGQIHTLKFVNRSYRTIRRFLPRLSSSIISDLIIKINNQEIQNTREYNMLFAILNDLTKEYDDIDSTSPDTVQEHLYTASGSIGNISKIQAVSRNAANTDKYFPSNKVSYFIDKWAGFLNEGNRYFDAREKDVKIIFRLAPANILYRGINSLDTPGADIVVNDITEYPPDYVISDIRASVDLLDDMPDMPQFIYNDYQYVQGNYLPNNKVSTTSFETNKPVNWVLGTFTHPDRLKDQELILQHCHNNTTRYGTQVKNSLTLAEINSKSQNSTLYSYELAKTHKEAYLLNSSGYFLRSGDGILSTKYKLNNYELSPDTDILSCYSESKKLFNTPYKKVQNMYSFESEFFCNAIAIDDNSEDSYKRIDWEVNVDPSKTNRLGGYPMLFYSFKNKL